MIYNIIILAHENAKVFQEGFGLNEKGELFLAISKGGIKKM